MLSSLGLEHVHLEQEFLILSAMGPRVCLSTHLQTASSLMLLLAIRCRFQHNSPQANSDGSGTRLLAMSVVQPLD